MSSEKQKHLGVSIVCSNPGEANEILNMMRVHIQRFGYASLNYLFDMVNDGLGPDSCVGWHDLSKVHVFENNAGCTIALPAPEEIFYRELIESEVEFDEHQ